MLFYALTLLNRSAGCQAEGVVTQKASPAQRRKFFRMAMAESENILTTLPDLLVHLIPQRNNFPHDQKFVLGDPIETKRLDVQEDYLRAYCSRDKHGHLLEANLPLEVVRHLARLANALKQFSNHTCGERAEKVDEVRRIISNAGDGAGYLRLNRCRLWIRRAIGRVPNDIRQ